MDRPRGRWRLRGQQSKKPAEVGPQCTEQSASAEAKRCQLPPPAAEGPPLLRLLVPLPQPLRFPPPAADKAAFPQWPQCSVRTVRRVRALFPLGPCLDRGRPEPGGGLSGKVALGS